MMGEELFGYTGEVARVLRELGAEVGDRIRIVKPDGSVYEGLLMPRYALSRKQIIVLKLDNGYNIGVRFEPGTRIELVEKRRAAPGAIVTVPLLEESPPPTPKPRVYILGTGGTIASKIEYETGAVKPAMSAKELLDAVPEIGFVAEIDAGVLFNILSENMTPEHWERIADEVARLIGKGYDGIVVAHGTDTMAYTAAALSFAFRSLPVPVVLVGAQRSSDRPSSDAAFNLHAAVLTAARAPFAEVVVVMHGETGDTYALAHRGTKVRKMHTSRRDAFQSINAFPLARIWPSENRIELLTREYRERGREKLRLENGFEKRVALVKYYPGMSPEIIEFLVERGYRGIVLEGTGLGHVGEWLIDSIKKAVDAGVVVVMTSQCLFGRVNMNVYTTGRKLLAAGVIPGEDMLPEVAFVKLSWVLAHAKSVDEAKRMMLENIAGEINPRHTVNMYPRWPHEP